MQLSFKSGNETSFSEIKQVRQLPIFSELAVGYLDELSKRLLKLPQAKQYPDIVTFAFWCRRGNILSMKKAYEGEINRIGRGIAFHIAPSNVPINFAYSLVAGLLAGNVNIVRLSSKEFEQIDIVCGVIEQIHASDNPDFKRVSQMVYLVRYSHSKEITDELSSLCSTRIIWGGDNTIAEIRKSPLTSRATEIMFADRYSLCVINSDNYMSDYDRQKTARDFYNDTYLTDQNACTSPKLIVWTGNSVARAKEIFWESVAQIIEKTEYDFKPVMAINKLTALYKCAAVLHPDEVKLAKGSTNKLMRIEVEKLDAELTDCFLNSGYFFEYTANSINEIEPLCSTKCQTVSYIGLSEEELREFVTTLSPFGIDRIVPVGKTLDFSLIWDGYDLIRSLSRKITIL